MSYEKENLFNVIVIALSLGLLFKYRLAPRLKQIYLGFVMRWNKRMIKRNKAQGYDMYNAIAKQTHNTQWKPVECIPCISFWSALFITWHDTSASGCFAPLVCYACGMMLERAIMRYF